MTFEEAFRAGLLADTPLAAAISTRLYQQKLPAKPTLPAVVYQIVNQRHTYTQGGANGLHEAVVSLKAWASSLDGAQALGSALIDAVHALELSGDGIRSNFVDMDYPDTDPEGDPAFSFRQLMVRVRWNEAAI